MLLERETITKVEAFKRVLSTSSLDYGRELVALVVCTANEVALALTTIVGAIDVSQ